MVLWGTVRYFYKSDLGGDPPCSSEVPKYTFGGPFAGETVEIGYPDMYVQPIPFLIIDKILFAGPSKLAKPNAIIRLPASCHMFSCTQFSLHLADLAPSNVLASD